jgi:hypothetical protein
VGLRAVLDGCGKSHPYRDSIPGPSRKKLLKTSQSILNRVFFLLWRCDPTRVMASSFLRFLNHTRRTAVGRTPLDE